MIRAVYHDGAIQPLDGLPARWQEGQALEIYELPGVIGEREFEEWKEGDGPMSDSVRMELERRLAALHALGPMEFEPGEEEDIEKLVTEMDAISRRQMQQLGEQQT
jgi:hypothetical protein